MDKNFSGIKLKTGNENIIDDILTKLSGSELNSFLLELFKKKSLQTTPTDVLKAYKTNRFTQPSLFNPVTFKKEELSWLENGAECGFQPVLISPLTPFGTSSAVAFVDQNNIVSSVRGTEAVSDATNVLALKTALDIKEGTDKDIIKYCTTHRHVRGQSFTNPAHSAHFGLYCMTTAGKDKGDFKFELENLLEHLEFYYRMLTVRFNMDNMFLTLYCADFEKCFNGKLKPLIEEFTAGHNLEFKNENKRNDYYESVQFKYFIKWENNLLDVIDGGFVDWTQKLLSNKKQRLLTSAAGIELILKILNR
jgi:hypothetical protein